MVRIKMARMKQTSRGRGLARGLPTATFTHVRAAMPRITVIGRKADGPPHGHAQGWPNTTAQPREQTPAAAVSPQVEPNIGPLPQPSFGELLYKLDLLRADTRRSIAGWERKMAELRAAHNSIIDNVGRETNEIISELKEIILTQEAEDLQSRRRALQQN